MAAAKDILATYLATITHDIIPLTAAGVASGCKVFGAAILRKSDLSLVVAATNHETASPLLHGEINCIQQFYAIPSDQRPSPKECLFLATHEPCSLCLSGITWSGFDNHTYLFSYEETRDAFSIPHDIRIIEEVFKVRAIGESDADYAARPLYSRKNAFWTARSLNDIVDDLDEAERDTAKEKIALVKQAYNALSETYQSTKGNAGIPLA